MCCMVTLVMGTYAIFSSKSQIVNHLEAGSLNIELKRTQLSYTMLNGRGYLEEKVDQEIVDFTKGTKTNVFGSNQILVPGSKYQATMTLSGLDSTVAFSYYIEIKTKDELPLLASQIKITYQDEENEISFDLASKKNFGSSDSPLGVMEVGEGKKTFNIQIEFLDQENNDLTMKNVFDFDIIVHAIQKIKE